MTDPIPTPKAKTPNDQPPSMPRWVKIFGIIILVVVLIFAIVTVAGLEHGPNLHGGALYGLMF
ncbi:MAG: hypothetical protein WEC37_03805 [Anaerolineales bacterium]